jgi:starch synthase (maltosyl-transferring)
MTSGPRIYNLFPSLVGSVGRWAAELPRIAALGFDWVYVNPFHETGYSGSLYAVKDYYRLNPLFRGEDGGRDDDLIRGFAEAARAHGIGVMMDLVVNHTARDAALTTERPNWYRRDAAGEIESPSANDPADPASVTVWTDLAELDYADRPERARIVAYYADVVWHYAQLGIRGFRCDAAYKVPADVWAALIGAAREVDPDVLFAAETLGAPFEAVLALRPAGFDYLFNSAKWWDFRAPWLLEQYERFRRIAPSIAFPESHDTPRVAAELAGSSAERIEAEYKFRYLFAAFFSSGVMMPLGYEFGFERAVDVVMTRPEHREQPRFDLSGFVTEANAMKAAVPALNEEGPQHLLWSDRAAVALRRNANAGSSYAVALINPDAQHETSVPANDLVRALGGASSAVEITPGAPQAPLPRDGTIALRPLEIRIFANAGVTARAGANGSAASPASQNTSATASEDPRAGARPVVIEAVSPEIDGGRHPVKRTVGERFEVEADIFREGHDAISAVLKYRERGETAWRETPMAFVDNDRWRGAFALERNTRYEYTLEGWPDLFGSWHHDVALKREAGQAIGLELIEGRALLDQALPRAGASDRTRLEATRVELDALAGDEEARADIMLGKTLVELMARVPDRSRATVYARELEVMADREAARYSTWYEFFPRSQGTTPHVHATFAEAARRLPDIAAMGFDVLYLPPIHPIGHAFRKGPNNTLDPGPNDPGSPWAIGNEHGGHTAVEPALGTLADFERFVRAARAQGIEIALDYALQCSPDHPYVREHPEWFTVRPDGTIKYAENPPKKYQDIVNFDWYGPHAPALWDELRDVVEFWIARGVRIFRVDNPHTKPFPFWEWLIADIQSRRPDVLFLAEAFTRPKVMKELAKLGFTQSYTYFTWRNFKGELTDYLDELAHSEMAQYYRPNFFANTPDILPPFLQTGGRPAFLIRLYLAATLSSVYGIYSGFELGENAALPGREEYLDSEKYEVRVRDWNAPGNLKAEIALVNRIRRENPALHDWRTITFLRADADNVLFFQKSSGDNTLLIAINLDPFHLAEVTLHLPLMELGIAEDHTFAVDELIGGEHLMWRGGAQTVRLDPARNPAAIFRLDRRLRVDYANPSL